ncbi:MAG TPA: 4'-phosphopantetheinyl transferase superfamily protein [Azonexus sp.]|nr:4'-phosphopantetheinyl transferase superfamily protein [Azonexus sp.]
MIEGPMLAADGLLVIAVRTPDTPHRDAARHLVRQTLGKTLGEMLAVDEHSLSLLSQPGQGIRLAPPWQDIGISVSHEPGLSLAAIHRAGPVGIDLLRLGPPLPDLDRLARDYLGPFTVAALAALPATQRQPAFAGAWCRLEAGLKCLGTPLGEWTPEIGQQLAGCTYTDIAMPAGWVAAVAITACQAR